MHARKLTVLVALVAVGATACGSSSKSSSGSPSAPTSASTTSAPRTSPNLGSFCSLAGRFQSTMPNPSIATKTPADLKTIYEQLPKEIQQAESEAPSAIKRDFATLANAEVQILSSLSKANFTKISAATFAGLDTARVRAASARIDQYMAHACGTSTPTT
jgi:hypothetical protein